MSLLKDKLELEIQEAELGTQKILGQFPPLLRWALILLLLAIIPTYYIAKNVSEKIWLSRYRQGAVLSKPSFTNPQAPKISPVSVTTLEPGSYAAAVKITNENLDLSVDNLPFEFVFYNAGKQQIYSYSNALFLLPDQTKYIIAPRFTATEQIAYADFQLPQNIPWQKRLSIPAVSLTTSVPAVSNQVSPPAFLVAGDFVNNSPYAVATVRLTFILFNSEGAIIGASQRDEFTVAPFERRSYQQLWPNLLANNLGRVEVDADTDTLNPNNLSASSVPGNNASNLGRP